MCLRARLSLFARFFGWALARLISTFWCSKPLIINRNLVVESAEGRIDDPRLSGKSMAASGSSGLSIN